MDKLSYKHPYTDTLSPLNTRNNLNLPFTTRNLNHQITNVECKFICSFLKSLLNYILRTPNTGHTTTTSSRCLTYHVPRGVRGVMAIVVGNGHGDTSSNPGRS